MTQLFANAARAELPDDITASATSIVLGEEALAPFPVIAAGSGDTFKVVFQDDDGIEIMEVTATDAGAFQVVRGVEGTEARAWEEGTVVGLRWTAGDARAAMQIAVDLDTHKSSDDHDGRYPTHAQVEYRFSRQASALKGPENVLALATAPIGYKGLNNIEAVVSAVCRDYDMYVITRESVGDPTDLDYNTTETIVQLLRDRGIKVYGIGSAVNAPALANWLGLGVDGMYIDQFQITGAGATATRADQIAWVNAVHNAGLSYMAGSNEYQDVFSDLDRDPLPRTPKDTFLIPNFISDNPLHPEQAGGITTYTRRIIEANTDGMRIIGRMRVAEKSSGGPDLSGWGNLDTLDKAADYAWGVASLYGLDGVLITGSTEGSSGGSTVIGAARRILPPDLGVIVGKVAVSGDQQEAKRKFSRGTLEITARDPSVADQWTVIASLDAPMVDATRAYSKAQTIAAIEDAIRTQATSTTDAAGVIQLATAAEAQALTNAAKAITPSTLGAVAYSKVQTDTAIGDAIRTQATSTTSALGVIQLATAAEAQALTNAAKAITPSTLGAVAYSKVQTDTAIGDAIRTQATSTTSALGVIQLATAVEAQALTNAAKAITPSTLGSVVNSKMVGVGQTWQNVTGQRAIATTYTNTTGRPIMVNVYCISDQNVSLLVGGVAVGDVRVDRGRTGSGTYGAVVSAIVPPGATYVVNQIGGTSLGFTRWAELR